MITMMTSNKKSDRRKAVAKKCKEYGKGYGNHDRKSYEEYGMNPRTDDCLYIVQNNYETPKPAYQPKTVGIIVKEITMSIVKEELSDDIYSYITEHCLARLKQAITNGLQFMKHSHRNEFTIQDFKNGLIGYYWFDNLPSHLINDEAYKFIVSNLC